MAHWGDLNYIGPVRSFDHLCQAFSLVHNNYVQLGYMKPHTTGMRYSVYEILPTSMTFVSVRDGRVTGTLTTVLDSMAGIPLENVFNDRLEALRRCGATAAEATMFACAHGSQGFANRALCSLMQYSFSWCCLYGVTDLCIVVNPCHRRFWQQAVKFEVLEETRSCRHVRGNPGVLLRLDIKATLQGRLAETSIIRKLRSASPDPRLYIDNYLLSDADVARLLGGRPEIEANLTRHQRAMMERYYGDAMPAAASAPAPAYG